MAAEGTRLGTGYVSVEPSFDRFQELLGKRLNQVLRDSKLGDRLGRSIGKELADSVGVRVRRATKGTRGDMFGLAGAINRVERESRRAGRASKGLERDMFGVNRAVKDSGRSLRSARTQLRDWHAESRVTASASRRLTDRIRSLGAQFRAFRRDSDRTNRPLTALGGSMGRVNTSFRFFKNILRSITWPLLIASVGLAAQGLSALAAGAVAATAAIGPLAGSLVALPAAALAAAQAIGTLKLATAGVGDAIKASLDVQIQGGEQAVDTMRRQQDAAEQVADAKRNLASVQRQARFAQEDLTEARRDATRELEDMREAADRSHESEEQGALALRQARQELNRTLNDVDATGLDIRLAESNVDSARADLQRTRTDAKRARQDFRDAQKQGVEGMPQVVAAKRAEEDATRAVQDAQRGLARATRDSTVAMEEQGSAATSLQEKMSQLPMAARAFVREIVGLKPKLDALRSTAASGFFPGATKGLHALLGNFGPVKAIVGETAQAFGNLAERAGKQLGSAEWGRDLRKLGKGNTRLLERMGEATMNLADGFRHILVAAQPFLDWLGESTVNFTEWIEESAEAGRETGRLADFFDRVREAMELTGPILKGVGGALLGIGQAARPVGNEILESLGGAAEGWREWTESTEGQNNLRRYFRESKPAIDEMGRLIRDVGKAFFELGRQKGVANLLRLVRTELIPAMVDLFGATTAFASKFLRQFGRLRKEGVPAFEAFLRTLFDRVGEAAPKLAWTFVKTFIGASIWGKLAIGGLVFKALGGIAAFQKLGAKGGRAFGTAFLGAMLAIELGKQIHNIIEGHKLGAPVTEKFARQVQEMFEIGLGKVKIPAPGRVRISTELGDLIFNAETEKVVAARGQKLQQFVGQIPAQLLPKFRVLSRGVDEALRPLPGKAEKAGKGINRQMQPELDRLHEGGGRKVQRFGARFSGVFVSLSNTSGSAIRTLMDNTGRASKALGASKLPKFSLVRAQGESAGGPSGGLGGRALTRQEGGPVPLATGGLASVVPGNLTGDRHVLSLNGKPVAKVESKEGIFVGNRNLMAAMQVANERVPRFATGGALSGLQPGAASLGRNLLDRFGGFLSSKLRPGDDGLHGRGMAVDWVGGDWEGAARYMNSIGPSLLEGIYSGAMGGPAVSWDSGQRVSPSFWGSEWGNHGDHIHGGAGQIVRAAIQKIERLILKGPDGPLKQMGQSAIDKVWKAANTKLTEQMGRGSHAFAGATATGNGADLMREISKQRGWNFSDWWELDARETSHGQNLVNPTSTARLRGQFLDMNWGKYGPGSDPSQNPTMAQQIISMADYIAERYRNPTAALAHHDVHNWYQPGGLVKQAALKLGGMLNLPGLQAGGGVAGLTRGFQVKDKFKAIKRQLTRVKGFGLSKGRFGALDSLSGQVETFSEFADNAQGLTITDEDGNSILGEFRGRSEGDWLHKSLSALGSLRNQLIFASEEIMRQRAQVQAMIERAKERLKALAEGIKRESRRRRKLVGNQEQARRVLVKARDIKDPKRRRQRIAQAQGTIFDLSNRIGALDLGQRERIGLRKRVAGLIPKLTERRTSLEETSGEISGEGGSEFFGLKRVQGLDGPLNIMAKLPNIGALGGEIGTVQGRLRQIGEEATASASTDDAGSEERASLLEELLRQANQRTAVEGRLGETLQGFEATYPRYFENLTRFHSGGEIIGPANREVPIMAQVGETMLTKEERAALESGKEADGGGSVVIEQLTVHEDGRATVRMGGREFDTAVEKVVRKTRGTGRATPPGTRF